jgi:hypothetical protein
VGTNGNLFLKMTVCGHRLGEAQRRGEKAQAHFQPHQTEEGNEEWRRARRLVENLARGYMAAARAWSQSLQPESAVEASQHISPALTEQFLLAGLPESEIAAIAKHLRICSECRCRKDLWDFWVGIAGEQQA